VTFDPGANGWVEAGDHDSPSMLWMTLRVSRVPRRDTISRLYTTGPVAAPASHRNVGVSEDVVAFAAGSRGTGFSGGTGAGSSETFSTSVP